jgi:uroporphyrin-III C-methyltransferase
VAELSEQPEPNQAAVVKQKEEDTGPAPRAKNGILFAIILLLLIFGLAGAGFYFFSQLRDKQEGLGGEVKSQLTRQINDYQAQLTAIQSQMAALQSELAGKEDHFNKTIAEFSDLHAQKTEATRKELSDKVLQVQRQLGKTRGDWLIADAEYLLSVANERLHLVGDINTTREALEAADQRLRESGDSGTIVIREQIAKEISQLQNIKLPDIVGLFASIQALENEVTKLTLTLPYSGKPLTSPGEGENSSAISEDSNDLVNSAIKELEGIVTIKRSDKPITEILTQEQAQFLREQLKVKLEILKIALVQQNDALFQASIKDIKAWVEQQFAKNEISQEFIGEMSRLESIKLRSQYPDISRSLKMLRDVTKLRIETDKTIEPSKEEPVEQGEQPKSNAGQVEPEAPKEPASSKESLKPSTAMPKK